MSSTKILLAEPNELLRKVLKERLRIEGFEVTAVEDGLKLEEELNKNEAQLVVSEELLPFKSGFELIQLCQGKQVPIIIISDADLEEKILEAFELGAADFIDKPFSPNEVIARIKNALKKSANAI